MIELLLTLEQHQRALYDFSMWYFLPLLIYITHLLITIDLYRILVCHVNNHSLQETIYFSFLNLGGGEFVFTVYILEGSWIHIEYKEGKGRELCRDHPISV